MCEGIGLFARRCLYRGDVVTAYAGERYSASSLAKRRQHGDERDHRHDYMYECEDGVIIDGQRKGRVWWTKEGSAQFANDAVHPDVTGKNNNCLFVEKTVGVGMTDNGKRVQLRRRVFLVADRDIDQDEELLVAYGLDYWLSWNRVGQKRNKLAPIENESEHRNCVLRDWLTSHARVTDHVVRPAFFSTTTPSTASSFHTSVFRVRELVRHSTTHTDPFRFPEVYGIPHSITTSRYLVEYKYPATRPECACPLTLANRADEFTMTYVDVRVEDCVKTVGDDSKVVWWNADATCAECGLYLHRSTSKNNGFSNRGYVFDAAIVFYTHRYGNISR